MKLSNFFLSLIASASLGLAVGASQYMLGKHPTAVISVPADETKAPVAGGGFSIRLPSNLTERQSDLLGMAYDIARKDGHRHPQLLQGILLQESNAGEAGSYKVAGQEYGLKPNERYYGVAQIKLSAAKDVLGRWPAMRTSFNLHTRTDEEIIAKLIENDEFNISIASKYLLVLRDLGYDTIMKLALAYNQGPGGARGLDAGSHPYARGVLSQIQRLSTK